MRTARVAVAIAAFVLGFQGALARAQQPPPDVAAEPAPVQPAPEPPAAEAPVVPAEPTLPVAAAPAPSIPAPAAPQRVQSAPQIGIAPGTPQTGSLVLEAPMPAPAVSTTPSSGEWKFDFHGFLRAPLRLGIGSGDD